MALRVHRSNRVERLVDVLVEVVGARPADPLTPECVIVQGQGMERWLSMELARHFGVWANPEFPFPRHFIHRAFDAVLGPPGTAAGVYEPETLMWAVLDALPAVLAAPDFEAIRGYLRDDESGRKRVQLAQRIATLLDRYVVYRPEMVLSWERGPAGGWQPALWRALVDRHGPWHLAARAEAFGRAVGNARGAVEGLPRRVSVFGISTLTPLYVRLLAALSARVEVHLFVLSPSREYWADIRDRRDAIRELIRNEADPEAIERSLGRAEGHPLLASLGRLGRDFQQVLEAADDYLESETSLYVEPGEGSALAVLQADILALRNRSPGSADAPPLPLADGDVSIAVHSCHSPMREVEVLHDQILAALEEDPNLQPRHVAVMSPAIDTYAPYIEAVFGGGMEGRQRIPYSIADRNLRLADPAIEAFDAVIDVLQGRMTATEVMDLFALDPVRRRFETASDELPALRRWLREGGVRWGVDGAHRREMDLPGCDDNTWRFGLDRLFVGYSMADDGSSLFGGVRPYGDIEGAGGDLLGRFAEFCDKLFGFRSRLREPRPLARWREDLDELLEAMVAPVDDGGGHQRIRDALSALAERTAAVGFAGAVDLPSVREQLAAEIERRPSSAGLLAGGVTCCALTPMRTIPFSVVCLIGMNDEVFPRGRDRLGFDLMAQAPQSGDRSPRDDDRYMFLEALLSARKRLIVTYVGQSISDNSELPPSVLVSDLLDAMGRSFSAPAAGRSGLELPSEVAHEAVRARVVTRHPLQPFSPRYFRGEGRLVSFAPHHHAGAMALVGARREPATFVRGPMPIEPEDIRVVTIDELIRFFKHPVRFFIERRANVRLTENADLLDDRLAFRLDELEVWQLGDDLLARARRGDDLATVEPFARAEGRLPPGTPGECLYADVIREVNALVDAGADLVRPPRLDPLAVERRLGDGTIVTGVLRDLFPAGQVCFTYSRLGGVQELELWLRHLLLCCADGPECEKASYLIGRPGDDSKNRRAIKFAAASGPEKLLERLIEIYRRGQEVPLPFFAKAARAQAERAAKDGESAYEVSDQVREVFELEEERLGAYLRQAFGAADPLGPAFEARGGSADAPWSARFVDLAAAVFEPLLARREPI